MKLVFVLAALTLTLGCCCSLPYGGETTSTTLSPQPELVCNAPYIRYGRECCLDSNGNGVCDADDVSTTKATTTMATTTTTLPQTTTRVTTTAPPQTTTTTKPPGKYAACVSNYGVTPDTVLYLYTDECCKTELNPHVDYVKNQGYNIRYINLANPTSTDTAVIHCIRSSLPDTVPEFICAGNGNSILLTEPSRLKITDFAKDCKESA